MSGPLFIAIVVAIAFLQIVFLPFVPGLRAIDAVAAISFGAAGVSLPAALTAAVLGGIVLDGASGTLPLGTTTVLLSIVLVGALLGRRWFSSSPAGGVAPFIGAAAVAAGYIVFQRSIAAVLFSSPVDMLPVGRIVATAVATAAIAGVYR